MDHTNMMLPSASEGRTHMKDTTSDNLDQTDEEILTYTVSDEALEDAAGTERGIVSVPGCPSPSSCAPGCC
jgi:hypothetical protein